MASVRNEVSWHVDNEGGSRSFANGYWLSLEAPRDDMWVAFAEAAQPYLLRLDGVDVGAAAIDDHGAVLALHLAYSAQHHAGAFLAHAVRTLGVVAAHVHTLDPGFLGPALDQATGAPTPLALLYHHDDATPQARPLDARLGTADDLEPLIVFTAEATGGPRSFLEPYLGARLAQGEVWIHEPGDHIVATGECRPDPRHAGYAHLGMIVHQDHRRQGLATRMLADLVRRCGPKGWAPVCSTEPTNHGSQRAILRAGFRPWHRVVRIPLTHEA